MQYRRLGGSGLQLAVLSFGAWVTFGTQVGRGTAREAAGSRFGDTVEVRCNGRTLAVPFTATYGDVARGRLTLCEDSFRAVMLAVNAGHASHELRVGRGEPVVIARLPQTT